MSEIDAAASRVLAHHWPDVPNLGDFTVVDMADHDVDALIAGTPCQAFSVAGLRQSLDDDRGNLTLQFVKQVHASKSLRWAVWENVPGVLSTKDNAFGCFLGGLVGADGPLGGDGRVKWPSQGLVSGPLGRAAWRLLDAKHFRVPQRRRRVFVVFCPTASPGDPAAVLLELASLRWDSEPGREAGERASGDAEGGADERGQHGLAPALTSSGRGVPRPGESRGQDPVVAVYAIQERAVAANPNSGPDANAVRAEIAYTLEARSTCQAVAYGDQQAFGGNNTSGPIDVATALSAHGVPHGRLDFESETFIAFGSKDSGLDAGPLAPTLRAGGFTESHANAGVPPAIAFALRGREGGAQAEISGDAVSALRAASGGSSRDYVAFSPQAGGVQTTLGFRPESGTCPSLSVGQVPGVIGYGVRRMTPLECERLQSFPDNHTRIPIRVYKKDPTHTHAYRKYPDLFEANPDGTWTRFQADGPRYKQCGNSMNVRVMRWILARIDAYERQLNRLPELADIIAMESA